MEKYAIIKLGGKQFMVKEGDRFVIERQESLNTEVLLFSDDTSVEIGSPTVPGIKVKAEFVKGAKDRARKIRIGRFRSKSRHRRIKGHRQPISTVQIVSIGKPVAVKAATPKKKVAAAKSSKRKQGSRAKGGSR